MFFPVSILVVYEGRLERRCRLFDFVTNTLHITLYTTKFSFLHYIRRIKKSFFFLFQFPKNAVNDLIAKSCCFLLLTR